jgi:hypothetical protein
MSRSPLLQLVRDSIEEVIEARCIIKRDELLTAYPALEQQVGCIITLKVHDEIRGEAKTEHPSQSLIDDIIYNAKVAAFQDTRFSPLTTAEYLRATISLSLLIPDEEGGLHVETSTDEPLLRD